MSIYLPIAGISVFWPVLLALGGAVGVLSGMFGVGGGFLMTPLLILLGVSPPVAVASSANQLVAASVSGTLAHLRRGTVDIKMGVVLLIGGFIGSTLGVWVFTLLRAIGQADLTISLSYVIFLGVIGLLMVGESGLAWWRSRNPSAPRRKLHIHTWLHGLPFKMRFRQSKLYVSALLPFGLGILVGVMSGIMGVGGGFVLVPAMIYVLGMPTSVVVGTSLFQIIFVMANVTFLQSIQNQTVDIMLALILLIGGVIGAQIGSAVGARLRGEQVRILLGLLVLAVALQISWTLITTPADLYELGRLAGLG